MIVPTLRVGMQPVTLCVTTVSGSAQAVRLEREASREAFPRRAWERSLTRVWERSTAQNQR
ncbi:hypothetical protein PS838_04123 [Pseudomonas fluorescens]|jgi:hypothetical protein|nr:hypothetical protein PS838_04123 [Pseudomonas fluorescens]